MSSAAVSKTILVLGGNGLLGQSICSKGVKKGFKIISISKSGNSFKTKDGFVPSWVNQVSWNKASPFIPSTYSHLLPKADIVISTLGILLESNYKNEQTGQVNPLNLVKSLAGNLIGLKENGNPLSRGKMNSSSSSSSDVSGNGEDSVTYERINRDAALAMYDSFSSLPPSPTTLSTTTTSTTSATPKSYPFIYISAEDIFRPFIPERYIETKRECERLLFERSEKDRLEFESGMKEEGRLVRPIVFRPSLIYHPQLAPLTTLPATVLSLSANIQSFLPTPLKLSTYLPSLSSTMNPKVVKEGELESPVISLGNLLTIEPIHVDTISEAIFKVLEQVELESEKGVAGREEIYGVKEMRKLAGYSDKE